MFDSISEEGNLTASKVLAKYSEETIFGLVFKEQPVIGKSYISPLREDRTPGCQFEYYEERLYFVDFADPIKTHNNCFNVVERYFNISNRKDLYKFILNQEIDHEYKPDLIKKNLSNVKSNFKKKTHISISQRRFNKQDYDYWSNYGIKISNLIEDKVIPVNSFCINNKYSINCSTIAYAFCEFKSGNIKIYRPFERGKYRFVSNCTAQDIGNISNIDNSETLIITKSYKDCRVIRNFGYNSYDVMILYVKK